MKNILNLIIKTLKFITPHGLVIWAERYYKYGKLKKPWNINTKRFWDYQYNKGYNFVEENYRPIPGLVKNKNNLKIIDLGCGIGGGVDYLSKKIKNSRVSGADISSVAVKKARKKYPNNTFFQLDLNKAIPAETYDYIIIVETLEHIDDPLGTVKDLLNKVEKGLIISVPYSPDKQSGPVPEGGAHVYNFNEETFKDFNYEVVHKDILHEGTMPRIIYKIYPETKQFKKL